MSLKQLFILLLFTSSMIGGCSTPSNQSPRAHKQYSIEQFLNTKNFSGGTFSIDEKQVLISSDESGVANVYSIDLESGSIRQRTSSTDKAIHIIADMPENKGFLFASDGCGNELYHIFLSEPNGTVRDLTPYPNSRSVFHGFDHDKTHFFFLSNQRDPRCMDLYEMDVHTLTSTLLFQNDEPFDIGEISSDKRYLTLTKIVSNNDQDLYLYDLSTKELVNLTPEPGEVSNSSGPFSVDSKTLYFYTDEGSDFTYIKSYDLEKRTFATVQKADWDITFYGFSFDGRYRCTAINEDGTEKVSLFDTKLHQPVQLPKLPEGEIAAIRIARSSEKMLLVAGSDRSPYNYYLFDVTHQSTQRLTSSLSPDMDIHDLVDAQVIRYPSYDGLMIPALYYKPHVCENNIKIPALIWVHGGPGGQSTTGYHSFIQFLVNHGYAVLAVNNRGSSGYGKTFYKAADRKHGEADLDDCMWAKKFLISTGEIDESHIGIIGGSYGGYMTLASLAFRPNEMACGIDLFGVSNWPRTLKSLPAWWESERELLFKKIGNPETDEVYLKSISPLFHAASIQKPLLVIQGANDPRVIQAESDEIVEAVRKNNVPCEYLLYADEGHGFSKKENQQSSYKAILHFLDTYLKKGT